MSADVPDRFATHLAARLKATPVRIVYTDNTHTMLSSSMCGETLVVRVHHMFADAPETIFADIVAGYVRTRGRRRSVQAAARARVQAYIESNAHRIRRDARRPRPLRGTAGHRVDLAPINARVNQREFAGRLDFDLTWSDRPTCLSMGRWYPPDGAGTLLPGPDEPRRAEANGQLLLPFGRPAPPGNRAIDGPSGTGPVPGRSRIVINALLDNDLVPAFYLDYLLYHEMLHEHIFRETGNARHGHRGPFARLEARHPDRIRALRWEKEMVDELWRRHRIREGLARRRRSLSM